MRVKTNDKSVSIKLKDFYENVSNEIVLSAILNRIYIDKTSTEIVSNKVNNQVNSMKAQVNQINPKFNEKSKNYDKMEEEMLNTITNFEDVLKQFCDTYDDKIEAIIFKKVELEFRLLMAVVLKEYLYKKETDNKDEKSILKSLNTVVDKIKKKVSKKEQFDVSLVNRLKDGQDIEQELQNNTMQSDKYKENQRYIVKLEKEIKNLNKEIKRLNEEKTNKIFEAMELGGKGLTTEIRKPRKLNAITRFFSNRFNTYKAIMKNIIEPMNQRIDEFKVNSLNKINGEKKNIELTEIEKKIISIKDDILLNIDNKLICKEMGILDK